MTAGTHRHDDRSADATLTCSYDALNRLVGATRQGVGTQYRYDAVGSRLDVSSLYDAVGNRLDVSSLWPAHNGHADQDQDTRGPQAK